MATLQLIRIDRDGRETILEETPVPDSFAEAFAAYPPGYIEELERYYEKKGKPRRGYIDALYICRSQVERWNNELLERYAPSLEAARLELEKRRQNNLEKEGR